MDFEIKIITTVEYPSKLFKVDLLALEDFIAQRLKDKTYGESVVKYFWGFELFRFQGGFAQFFSNDIESWKYSRKWFVTNSHFDWDVVKDLDYQSTLQLVKKEFLNSLSRIERMKRKPRDFNYLQFNIDIEFILDEYLKTKNET